MSKRASNDTLLRQWAMLRLLPTRGAGITASELTNLLASQGFDIDIRTVQRDLNKLSGPFPFVCNDKSVPQGWHWMPGANLDIPGLSVPEALTLKMVEDYLTPLLPASLLDVLRPHLDQATRTLEAMEAENPAARWTEKIRVVHPTMAMKAPAVDANVLATLQEGLLREQQVEVAYQRFGAETPSTLRIHPLSLVQRGPSTYVVATTFDYDDIRLYAVHRMLSAELLEEDVERPDNFDIDVYIREGRMHFGGGGAVELKLWVDKDLASILRESPLSDDMVMIGYGDGYEVTATVPDTWQLKWWLLSNTGQVIVKAPEAVREMMIRRIQEALEQYASSQSSA